MPNIIICITIDCGIFLKTRSNSLYHYNREYKNENYWRIDFITYFIILFQYSNSIEEKTYLKCFLTKKPRIHL